MGWREEAGGPSAAGDRLLLTLCGTDPTLSPAPPPGSWLFTAGIGPLALWRLLRVHAPVALGQREAVPGDRM